MIPTDIMLNKGRCDKTVWFYLYSIQEQAKWIDVDTWSQKGDYRWGGWVKWRERTFWGDRNILYLDLDDSYSDVYKCKELLGYNLHTFLLHYIYSRHDLEDTKLSFPHGLVVKNLPANSGLFQTLLWNDPTCHGAPKPKCQLLSLYAPASEVRVP